MPSYFADTGYWLALLDRSDSLHHQAKRLADKIKALNHPTIYTTDLVLAELLNSKPIYSNRIIRMVAAEMVIEIRASEEAQVIGLTGELFGAALLKYKTYEEPTEKPA